MAAGGGLEAVLYEDMVWSRKMKLSIWKFNCGGSTTHVDGYKERGALVRVSPH